MPEDTEKTRYLTPSEAASQLMISPVTLRHWALDGKLAFITTPGGHRRFAETEIARFAASHYQAIDADEQTRILIVDDDTQLTGFLVELFAELPAALTIAVAHDGFEAGQKMLSFRPHKVLLDLMMPGLKGFEVCQHIKNNPLTRETHVVVMTGYNSPENIAQALQAGAAACLPKPLDKSQLFDVLALK
jgi:excisionase family DNA binding protein